LLHLRSVKSVVTSALPELPVIFSSHACGSVELIEVVEWIWVEQRSQKSGLGCDSVSEKGHWNSGDFFPKGGDGERDDPTLKDTGDA
jgi:hypothetical protein